MEALLNHSYLLGVVFLTLGLLVLRGLTTNPWIKKRLSFALFLLSLALVLIATDPYLSEAQFETIWPLLIALALILAIVVSVFNRFRGKSVSEKYPSIVQDAIVVAAFAVIAIYYAPDKLTTPSAIGALVLGLALQDTLGNLFSGLALQIEKPFFVGNWVRAAQLEGKVMEMTWRATKIRTKKGEFCVIPNSVISKDTIVNYTHPSPVLRMEKTIRCGYETHPNHFKEVVLDTVASIQEILTEPRPDLLLERYDDFYIEYRCRFWIDSFEGCERIVDYFTSLLYYRLERSGIKIPLPIRDVRLRGEEKSAQKRIDRGMDFVSRADIFAPLGEDQRNEVVACLEPLTYASNEIIIEQGDPGDCMFFVRRGKVRIVLERNGRRSQIALLEAGQYFGEMSLLTGEPRTASAFAVTDVKAYVLSKAPFREVLVKNPQIAEELSQILAKRQTELMAASEKLDTIQPPAGIEAESFLARIRSFFGLE